LLKVIRSPLGIIKRQYFKSDDDFQIEMFITKSELNEIKYSISPDYLLRPSNINENQNVYHLMLESGLIEKNFTIDDFSKASTLCIPNGNLVIEHVHSKKLVGAFMLRHNFDGLHNFSAQLDWLAVDKQHRGNNFGSILTAALVRQAFNCNYKIVFVATNDSRLAAIMIYLKVGFIPNLYNDNMIHRWKKLCNKLLNNFDRERYIKLKNKNNIYSFLREK